MDRLEDIDQQAAQYGHVAIEHKTVYENHKHDFIQGALSDAAKQYWYEEFKKELTVTIRKFVFFG